MKIKMKNEGNLTLEQGFARFISRCKVKNLSERSIDYYEKGYERFIGFCDKDTLLENISQDVIEEYVFYLKENTKANDVTIASYMRAIRAIFYYFMNMNFIDSYTIFIPKADKKVKETYTDYELSIMLMKPNIKECSFVEYRTWVYFNYLLGTGNRVSTSLNLKIKDLDFDNQLIKLEKTKNRKQQIIPMSASLKTIMLEYLEIRGGNDEDYVFCTEFGKQLKIRSVEDSVKFYNNRRGINKSSCHLLRHTYTKKFIMLGGDVFRLQKLMGHYSIDVTREYVEMFGGDLKQDYDMFNPLDNMLKNNYKNRKISM